MSTFIPEETIREIRTACSIVEVISHYVSLKKTGNNYKGLCPFHNEKTPSFIVNEERKFFHCFGCHEKGDIFTFLMKHERMNFQEAVRFLAKRSGIPLPEKKLSREQQKRLSEREAYFRINEIATEFYHKLLLNDPRYENARSYLNERGIDLETIKTYKLGCAPDSWDALVLYLKSTGIVLSHAQKIGLIISKGRERYYDRFRNRIIFPIRNVSRHIIGFGGRIIDKGEPKYLNSPESVIYNKRHNLYGLDTASHYIQKEDRVIIVEGYLDVLTLHQEGIKNVVASLGTALTEQQIQIVRRYTSKVVTVFDSDPAGEKAMIRCLEPFLKSGLAPRLVSLPSGDDPDSFVKQYGEKVFSDKVEKAGLLLDFVIEKIIQKHQIATPRGKIDACEEIGQLLNKISDEMERDLTVQNVSRRIDVKESQLKTRMGIASKGSGASGFQKQSLEKSLAATESAERIILKLLISHPDIINLVATSSFLEEFTDPNVKDLCMSVTRIYQEYGEINLSHLMDSIQDESWKNMIMEDVFTDDISGDPGKTLEDCIRAIRLKKNDKDRKKVNECLKQAEAVRDEPSTLKFQKEFQNLLREKKKILAFKLNFLQI